MGEPLVLAERHAHGRGEIGQRLPATHPPTTLGEREQSGLGIVDLDLDAAPASFVDDDLGVGVELGFRPRAEEQRLVEAVLALDGEGLQVAEAELGIERLGLLVVVQHGQVQVGQAAPHVVLDQMAYQCLADAGSRATGRDCQAPEARTVFRIIESAVVIDAHHAADDLPGGVVLGQPVHRPALLAWRAALRVDRHHAARLIEAVDRMPVRLALGAAHAEAAKWLL